MCLSLFVTVILVARYPDNSLNTSHHSFIQHQTASHIQQVQEKSSLGGDVVVRRDSNFLSRDSSSNDVDVCESLQCIKFVMNSVPISYESDVHNRLLKSTVERLVDSSDTRLTRICNNNHLTDSRTSYSRMGLVDSMHAGTKVPPAEGISNSFSSSSYLKSAVAYDNDSPPIDDSPVFDPAHASEVDVPLPQPTIDLLPTAQPTDAPDDDDLSIAAFDIADADDTDR